MIKRVLQAAALLVLVGTSAAIAQVTDVASMAGQVQGQLGAIGTFAGVLSFLLGFVFGIMGLLKLRAHQNNPNDPSNTPTKAFALIFVGVALIGIPTIMGVGVGSLFGTGADTTDLTGTNTFTEIN
ncbi:MAG: hypothetical protein F4213_05560 [Boseongicola sp. SB0677_bin_26]|nr:hypothetical protein [Boseongicola sp. SB0665_bin_10]MYG25473.1 hypothetical protein [Boseongicola sp. SB0677_bin_26]